jgi:hypothetical protein
MYLTLKSWQRFTETWALLERAGRLGLFEPHTPVQPPKNAPGCLALTAHQRARVFTLSLLRAFSRSSAKTLAAFFSFLWAPTARRLSR